MVINFILVSTCWALNLALFISDVRYYLMDQTATTFIKADKSQETWRVDIAQTALQQLMLTLSDFIVIWRAWVIVRRPWIMGAPILLVVASTGVAFLLLQGLNIIVNFLPFDHYSAFDFFQTAISGSYRLLTGMYPTIVVYLVNQQSSLVEVFALSDPNGNGTPQVPVDRTITIGPLIFARSDSTANANATSLTVISDMGFRDIDEDTDKSGTISPVDCIARKKAQEMTSSMA
ncbi:hypothetical protein C0995_004983 [Termitomyces sp. Mi166|nr:hypothetical protein C0995_004983 [Termitomyces sp. Mi166\